VAAVDGASVRMGGSAGDVWDLLPDLDAEPVTVASLVATLADDFDEDADVVERDVTSVLDALEAIGCVVRLS
jgi:hypothetical protein